MEALLKACWLKVLAAEEHLTRLDNAAERFFEEHPDVATIDGELNAQRTKYLFRVNEVIDWPAQEWGVMIGDATHCLRSALDHLTHGLLTRRNNDSQFPIFRKGRDWITKAPAMYWSVPDEFVAIFNDAQPYHRGDAAAQHPLSLLNALSNLDKHRAIPTTALVPDNSKGTVTFAQGVIPGRVHFFKGTPYKPGAVVAECKFVPDDSGLEPEMNVHIDSVFDIGFGEIPGAPWLNYKPAIATFKEVIGGYVIDEVFNRVTMKVVEQSGGTLQLGHPEPPE